MLRIAIITTSPLRPLIESVVSDINAYCDPSVFEAASERDAREIYERESSRFDAAVFTEQILMVCATKNGRNIVTPCFALDDFAADPSATLYKLLLRDRSFDFSKVSIDIFPSSAGDPGYDAFFPPDQKPCYLDDEFKHFLSRSDIGYLPMDEILFWHISHFRSKKTAFALTRFGIVARGLEAAGIPHAYFMPSAEYVFNFLAQTLGSLTISSAFEQKLAVVALRFFGRDAGEYARFAEIAASEARLAGLEPVIFHYPDRLEVNMRYSEIVRITRDFTVFPTFEHVFGPDIAEKISGGIGTGNTLFQARMNAAQALAIAGTSSRSYHVSHTGQMTGPLGRAGVEYPAEPGKGVIELAEKYGIDHVALQNLRAYISVTGTKTLTAMDYAEFSDISRRTANRILTKLTQGGGARAYHENAGGKGRPKLRYQLMLD